MIRQHYKPYREEKLNLELLHQLTLYSVSISPPQMYHFPYYDRSNERPSPDYDVWKVGEVIYKYEGRNSADWGDNINRQRYNRTQQDIDEAMFAINIRYKNNGASSSLWSNN